LDIPEATMHLRRRDELANYLNDAGLVGTGVEVGVAAGDFSRTILSGWEGRELVLIDAWTPQPDSEYHDIFNAPADIQAVHRAAAERVARDDSRVRLVQALSPAAADRFADGSLDFVYLDGNHAYLAARDDLAAWYPKIRPGGLFAGHDYLDGIRNSSLYGVRTAVDEFAAVQGRAVCFTTEDPPHLTWYFRKPFRVPPVAERITVLTAYDETHRNVGEISRPNKEAYCRRHGYRFVCRTDGFDATRPASWSKLDFVREALRESDWVFWTDADSLVMNAAVPLAGFLDDTVDAVLSADPFSGLNAGAFLIRRTPWAFAFLDRIAAQTDRLRHPWWETAAVLDLYRSEADVRRHAAVVPNKLFNGYPYEGGNYAAGDFIVHFPGLKDREAALRNYAAMAR
jgi:hypothetical protein